MPDQQEHGLPRLTDADGNPIELPGDAAARAHANLEAKNNGDYDSAPLALWWSLSKPNGGGTHIRVTEDDGRWQITDVYIHGSALTATDLQAVPLTKLDLFMNLVGYWPSGGLTDPDDIAGVYNVFARDAGYGQAVYYESDPDELSLGDLRAFATDAPPELPKRPTDERPRLTRPDGTDPDGFAARVAAAYREYAQTTRAPAVEIAAEANVPVATVRSWIREARRRGKLPEGRKGKAG